MYSSNNQNIEETDIIESSFEEPLNDAPSTKQKKILLVEDDKALASVYESRLIAEGFETLHVDNGESALAEAVNFRPDLVILDVMMPKISGFDVLDLMRGSEELSNMKVMMLTALGQDKDQERAEKLGVDKYLIKSQVSLEEIIDSIRELLVV